MTDVELINKLCEIDNEIRKIKKQNSYAIEGYKKLGITTLPPELMKVVPEVLKSARMLLSAKTRLRLQLWKEYGIFYWSDV